MSKRLRDKEAWIVTAKREQAYEKEHPELIEGKVAELKEIRKQKDMTRAEQAALKAYPECAVYNDFAMEYTDINECYRVGFEMGYEQAEKDLGWHSVDECLPEIDEEVIVLTDYIHGKTIKGANYLCFGHIVDKTRCIDYNGWNIPGVKFWMPCPEIPNND